MELDFLIWPGLQITCCHCDEANFQKKLLRCTRKKLLAQNTTAHQRPGKISATDENDHRRNAYFA